jgi:uncharacterized protein with PhoU and TrkA domain
MRLSEVSRSEIWGFFAGKSQIIAVRRPERSESLQGVVGVSEANEEVGGRAFIMVVLD